MSIILPDAPDWMQNVGYPARLDRHVLDAIWTEGVISGLGVTQRAEGANFSVDVAAGYAAIAGDDQADQGAYLARVAGLTNVPIGTSGAQARVDLIVLRVNDEQAGGPTGNNGTIEVIAGTPAASNPQPPALPTTAVELARVTVPASSASIVTANIDTGKRTRAGLRASGGATLTARSSSREGTQSLTLQNTMHGGCPPTLPGYFVSSNSIGAIPTTMTFSRDCLVAFDLSATRTGGQGTSWQPRHVLPNGQIKLMSSESRGDLTTVMPVHAGDVFQMGFWVGSVGLTLFSQSYVSILAAF